MLYFTLSHRLTPITPLAVFLLLQSDGVVALCVCPLRFNSTMKVYFCRTTLRLRKCEYNSSNNVWQDTLTHRTLNIILLYYSASRSPKVCLVVFSQKTLKVKGVETHYRARPLAVRPQGNTTVLIHRSPPPVRLSQGQQHVHGAAGVRVHLTERRRVLGQEVMELPHNKRRQTHSHTKA